jgi:hypothetical protein
LVTRYGKTLVSKMGFSLLQNSEDNGIAVKNISAYYNAVVQLSSSKLITFKNKRIDFRANFKLGY